MRIDSNEDHFTPDLFDLVVLYGTTHIVQMTKHHRPLMTDWLLGHLVATLGMTANSTAKIVLAIFKIPQVTR